MAGGCAGADLGGRVKGARGGPWMASVSCSPSIGGIAPASSAKPVHERLEDGGKRASIPCLVENDPPRGSLAMIGHCRNQLRFLELSPCAIGPGRSSAAERGRPLIRPSRFRAVQVKGLIRRTVEPAVAQTLPQWRSTPRVGRRPAAMTGLLFGTRQIDVGRRVHAKISAASARLRAPAQASRASGSSWVAFSASRTASSWGPSSASAIAKLRRPPGWHGSRCRRARNSAGKSARRARAAVRLPEAP